MIVCIAFAFVDKHAPS